MLKKPLVVGQSVTRVDLVGVRGATKKFRSTFRPKVAGGDTLDLTGAIVRAAFKINLSDVIPVIQLSSLFNDDRKITVTIIPATMLTDLESVVEFELTPAMTRLLSPNSLSKASPVWSIEFEDTAQEVYPLFAGEARFSEEIV